LPCHPDHTEVPSMPQTSISNVLSSRYDCVKGKDSWRSNLRLTALAAEEIRSSLGPNGAYKLVIHHRGPEKAIKVTRDATAVLEELALQYPTLVVVSEAAKIQKQEFGDGVKAFIIFCSALLQKADQLIAKGVHPNVILKGYEEAAKKTLEVIQAHSKPLANHDFGMTLEAVDCGRGCLTPDLRANIIAAAELANKDGKMDRDRIRVVRKQGGEKSETTFIKGIVIKKGKLHPNMPNTVLKPKIALASERIGTNRMEIKMPHNGPFQMKFAVEKPSDLDGYRNAENQRKADVLGRLGDFGVNVLFSQQPIDEFSKSKLACMGVLAFESVDRADLALISKATGAKLEGPLSELAGADVGTAERLEMDKIGLEETATLFGCDFVTFLLRGSNPQVLDELEQLIGNSLSLLRAATASAKTVAGAGAIEIEAARQLKDYAMRFSGKEQLALTGFAEALLEVPRSLAGNCGLFSDQATAQLAKFHSEGSTDFGLSADGSCGNVCVEVAEAKAAAMYRAFEVTRLMLRIDEQITAKEVPKFHKQ
jgi:archaeal chaperonin